MAIQKTNAESASDPVSAQENEVPSAGDESKAMQSGDEVIIDQGSDSALTLEPLEIADPIVDEKPEKTQEDKDNSNPGSLRANQ